MKKAVIFIADGSEEIEALTPVDYLRRAGVEVTLVAVSRGGRTVMGSHKISINADMTLDSYLSLLDCSNLGSSLPDAIVVPGGLPGTTNIASCSRAVDFIRLMDENDKLVCANCAAPAIVLSASASLEGRKWTCYPGMKEDADSAYHSSHVSGVAFVHDRNLITASGPGSSEEFSMEIVKTLCGEEIYRTVKDKAVQR